MIKTIKNWFSKNEDHWEIKPSHSTEIVTFDLMVDGIHIGLLKHEDSHWIFQYTEEFKNRIHEYNRIIGFPDLNKIYMSQILWPFFQIRIPGLKQPAVQEILNKENIDQSNEVALLKRFGFKSISNPYELLVSTN